MFVEFGLKYKKITKYIALRTEISYKYQCMMIMEFSITYYMKMQPSNPSLNNK